MFWRKLILCIILPVVISLAQEFGPATVLLSDSGDHYAFDVLSMDSPEFNSDETTYLCWINRLDTRDAVYFKQLGPLENQSLLVWQDTLAKGRCRLSKITRDSLRIWWQEKNGLFWRICYVDVNNQVLGTKKIAIDSLTTNPRFTANDGCLLWLADSSAKYWVFKDTQAGPNLLDLDKRITEVAIDRSTGLPVLQFLVVVQSDKGQEVLLLQGGTSEDDLWLIIELSGIGTFGNPQLGFLGSTTWQSKPDSVWQLNYGFYNKDSTGNTTCNYQNGSFFQYPQLTKYVSKSTPFFLAFDSDSIPDNREVWILEHDVRSCAKIYRNISNGSGNDHHPQVAYVYEGTSEKVGLFWQKEVDGRNEIWQARADFVPDYGAIRGEQKKPQYFILQQNYPNPFNATTLIQYILNRPGHVRLELFNTLGGSVRILIDQSQLAGSHQLKPDLSDLASGVYFMQLALDHQPGQVRKILLMK